TNESLFSALKLFDSKRKKKESRRPKANRDSSTLLPQQLNMQLFFSYFKDLVGREVTVELKNDLAIRGTLHSVDQYLNIKLENTRVVDQDKYPHMISL
ncbi:Sm-like protein LSM2, partial [Linum perenne]